MTERPRPSARPDPFYAWSDLCGSESLLHAFHPDLEGVQLLDAAGEDISRLSIVYNEKGAPGSFAQQLFLERKWKNVIHIAYDPQNL